LRVESLEAHGAVNVFLGFSEGPATPIFIVRQTVDLRAGETTIRCNIPRLPLPRGRFYTWTAVTDAAARDLVHWHPVASADVIGPTLEPAPRAVVRLSPLHVHADWDVER